MSGIAGIYNFDGRPVDAAALSRMVAALDCWGPDGTRQWVDGPVGLGHSKLQTTPESIRERQPLTDDAGALCLTFDGRVDNRRELRADVEAKGERLRDDTDAELVLAAYRCWGEGCAERIIGDFAFVVWDARDRVLFCARDPLGTRPFYYYGDDRTFLFASDLPALFAHGTVPRAPNEGMIAEYLACAITDLEETLYRHVHRLPPAHSLVVKRAGPGRKARYWDVDPRKEIRYRQDSEYADHFLQVFKEAVRCRMRSVGPVGAELSGGLDSSSVASVAHRLRHDEGLAGDGFETFSLVFPGRAFDESAYIDQVVRMHDLKSHRVEPHRARVEDYLGAVRRHRDFPPYPTSVMHHSIGSRARERGVRVMLGGGGGDEWLTGSFYHYADMLRGLKLIPLVRQLLADRQFNHDAGVPAVLFPSLAILRVGLVPLIPDPVRWLVRLFRGARRAPAWIDQSLAERTNLAERLQRSSPRVDFATFAQRQIHSQLANGWAAQGNESGSRLRSQFRLEARPPLSDRRLIEFALALPETQRWRAQETKLVLRGAMRGLLPQDVRLRASKADFSAILVEALEMAAGRRFFENLRVAAEGWVDGAEVGRMYGEMLECYSRGDFRYSSLSWRLWMIFGIESWLRGVFAEK